jgi:signal transduction histidine kinase
MRPLSARIAALDLARLDWVVAAGMVVALELELRPRIGDGGRAGIVTAVAAVLFAAPIAVRRRWPVGSLIACAGIAAAQALLGGHLSAANGIIVPPVLLAYAAGAWLDARRARRALSAAMVAFGGFVLSTPTPHSAGDVAAAVFLVALLFAAPWLIGRLARESSRRAAAFQALAAQAAAESEERERAAIAEERARMGHELQDIIAHSVSAMIIQAGGARRMLPTEPQRARDSILAVERTGREALADLRRLLGMLRKDDDQSALAPQPGLDQVAALVESMRHEGLACVLRSEGEPIDLTPGVDLVGYRVIEAALRAGARHHSLHAAVTVRFCRDQLELEIRGDRPLPELPLALGGLSQRVALYDGSLRAVPPGNDGFAVLASLPLGAAVVA